MRKLYVFLLNGVILTGASLLIRLISVWFNAYISQKIGAEGMGLYTLVMSVYSLAVTAAIFGMGLACTRLVAEEEGKRNFLGVRYSVRVCTLFGALCGVAAAVVIYVFSDFIGTFILQNEKTVISLRAFAVCLPFLSVSCILNGYFTSVGRIIKSSAVQFAELFTRILASSVFLNAVFPKTLEYSCLSVVLGRTRGTKLLPEGGAFRRKAYSHTHSAEKIGNVVRRLAFKVRNNPGYGYACDNVSVGGCDVVFIPYSAGVFPALCPQKFRKNQELGFAYLQGHAAVFDRRQCTDDFLFGFSGYEDI